MVGLTDMPGSECTEGCSAEEGRGFRQKKKHAVNGPQCCPVCEVTVRPGELAIHLNHEVTRLVKLSDTNRAQRRMSAELQGSSKLVNGSLKPEQSTNRFRRGPSAEIQDGYPTTSGLPRKDSVPTECTADRRNETYKQIRSNRQSRLRVRKGTKRKADEVTCPICNERLHGTPEELNVHVDVCLKRRNDTSEEGNVDVEDMYEEYEWAGQRRIRTSTLLVGGYAATGMATSNGRSSPSDDDMELVVDVVDTYGPAQYSEADVVLLMADGPKEEKKRAALRDAVISPCVNSTSRGVTSCVTPTPLPLVKAEESHVQQDTKIIEPPASSQQEAQDGVVKKCEPCVGAGEEMDSEMASLPSNHVIEALKKRIAELEGAPSGREGDCFKCLICMEKYSNPVISVCCWHVHCEMCWLHTLGAKKLCPQCSMITSPSDLRKIYI